MGVIKKGQTYSMKRYFGPGSTVFLLIAGLLCGRFAAASVGTEGAAFLDIPVGAGPAAMGAAYTALAKDAYAPVWNPAGLGFLPSTQFSGQHLAYLDTLNYEYASFVMPLGKTQDYLPTRNAIGG